MHPKKPPLFIDLDETLIHAAAPDTLQPRLMPGSKRLFDYQVVARPEASEILRICREGGREVFLFTMANFGFALTVSETFKLGFDERSIFSLAMILNCRRGLSPRSALIENKPPGDDSTELKMAALGISAGRVWVVPSYEPPRFASAKLFTLGLPLRLARLDRGLI